jgi:hypothetical protein
MKGKNLQMGAGTSKRKCLERAENWADFCETPGEQDLHFFGSM